MHDSNSNFYDRLLARIPWLKSLQDWLIALGKRKSAMRWLLGLSFLESIIFPIPIDPLLAVLVLARPEHYIRIALLTAIAGVLGGIVGWGIGAMIGEAVIAQGWLGSQSAYAEISASFAKHGWLLVFIGAFTPLPYKLVVVSVGFLGLGFFPFLIASLIGRTLRFTLIAAIVHHRRDTKKASLLMGLLVLLVAVCWWFIQ